MCAQRIVRHQLPGNLTRECFIQSATDIDGRQFTVFKLTISGKFFSFAIEVRVFGVGLRTDRNILASRHRHRPGDQSRNAGHHDVSTSGLGGGHSNNQTGGGHNAIVSA